MTANPSVVPGRFSTRGTALRLFLTCWVIYVLHFATNIVREIYPVLSLGDHASFDVSEYEGLHPDIFKHGERGTFINNNPGASIVGAVPYTLARPVIDRVVQRVQRRRAAAPEQEAAAYDSPWKMAREFHRKVRERGLDIKLGLAAGVTQAFAMAPLSALSVVVMFYMLVSMTRSVRVAVWLSVLYAFATPVFYRTAQLNQNLLVAHCALFAFALLWRPWDEASSPRRPHYFLSGLLCGWAVVCDYSGVIVVLVLSAYGLVRRASLPSNAKASSDPWRFALGVVAAGAVLMGYQWSSFGHPLFPAQQYMPAANFTEKGYVGFDWPSAELLWTTLFDYRYGLFVSAPVLLAALWVPGWLKREVGALGRRERVCIVVLFVLFLLFCSANQYGRMQFNTGVRHVIPVTPFVFLLAAIVIVRLPTVVAVVVGVTATYWSWCLCMFRDVEANRGVLESVIQTTLGGIRFPWLTTVERMGFQFPAFLPQGAAALLLLVVTGGGVAVLWWRRGTHAPDRIGGGELPP